MEHIFTRDGVTLFIRRCYEVGKTPIWQKGDSKPKRKRRRRRRNINMAPRAIHRNIANRFVLNGELKKGAGARFSINGEHFEVSEETWIIGALKVGAIAEVRGVDRPGEGKFANKIVIKNIN